MHLLQPTENRSPFLSVERVKYRYFCLLPVLKVFLVSKYLVLKFCFLFFQPLAA